MPANAAHEAVLAKVVEAQAALVDAARDQQRAVEAEIAQGATQAKTALAGKPAGTTVQASPSGPGKDKREMKAAKAEPVQTSTPRRVSAKDRKMRRTIALAGTVDGNQVMTRQEAAKKSGATFGLLQKAFRASAQEMMVVADKMVSKFRVSDVFGIRPVHPVTGALNVPHNGTDLVGDEGTEVNALIDGHYYKEKQSNGYWTVGVKNPYLGLKTRYRHTNPNGKHKEGEWVQADAKIGKIAPKSEEVTGVHSHLEIEDMVTGKKYDPQTIDLAAVRKAAAAQSAAREGKTGPEGVTAAKGDWYGPGFFARKERLPDKQILKAVFVDAQKVKAAEEAAPKRPAQADLSKDLWQFIIG